MTAPAGAPTSGSISHHDFPVTGMSCASCAARIERTLADVPGVAHATVNFALPVAALGLLNPVIAGAAMAFSSVSVVLNSLRLYRFGTTADNGPVPGSAGPTPPMYATGGRAGVGPETMFTSTTHRRW